MPHSTATTATNGTTKTVKNMTLTLAPLETISYASILAEDPHEKERLLKACQHPGFFYLDLQTNDEGKQILKDLKEAHTITEKYIAKHGPSDKMKDIAIRRDDLSSPPDLPADLQEHLPLWTRLSRTLHDANLRMATQLYPSIISPNHSPDSPSDTALDLISAPSVPLYKDAPDTTHTDSGTMTILCTESWGSMIEDPETKEWAWAEPKAGCALVNVGDWFDRESRKIDGAKGLRSCKHAQSQVGDGAEGKYFVASYLRPAKTAA